MALVAAGGEVAAEGLEGRVQSAWRLIFLFEGDSLCGIAAMKQPQDSYRRSVAVGAGVPLKKADFPFELGWVFVMPSARGKKYSIDLVRAGVKVCEGKGVFTTSRTENSAMHAALKKCGFTEAGKPYGSKRGDYKLQLFTRPTGCA